MTVRKQFHRKLVPAIVAAAVVPILAAAPNTAAATVVTMTIHDTQGWYSINGGPQISGAVTLDAVMETDDLYITPGYNGRQTFHHPIQSITFTSGGFTAGLTPLTREEFVETQGSDGGAADALGFGWRMSYGSVFTVGPGAFFTSQQTRMSLAGDSVTYQGEEWFGMFDPNHNPQLTVSVSPAPEPATLALSSAGLLGVWLQRKRKRTAR